MSNQIPTFNYQSYSQGIEMLVQQMSRETRGAVMEESMSSERVFFDQIGAVAAVEKTGRAQDVAVVNTPHARRSCTATDYAFRDFVDSFDKLKILNDPTNAYSQAFSAANARKVDQIVMSAALGTAYTGKEGTTAVPLPSAQKIAAATSGFTLAKLQTAVQRIKSANALMPGDSLHVAWTAKQELQFINTDEVKSFDFNNQKVMVDGRLTYFYGCYFHRMEDDDASGEILPLESTTRSCVLWAKSGLKLGTWKAPYGSVDWLPEKQTWQVLAGMSVGATRMQEKKVIQIDVVES